MIYQPYQGRVRTIRALTYETPWVTLTRNGVLNLNAAAYTALGSPAYLVLAFDKASSKVALIPAGEDSLYALPVRWHSKNSRTRVVSARGFLSANKISREEVRRFQAEVDGEGRLTFKVEGRRKVA